MDKAQYEALLQTMRELTDTVKSHANPKTSLDWDSIQAQFGEQIKTLVDLQVQEKLDNQPQRRVPGATIQADGTPVSKSNRYFGWLKDFERDGVHKVGTRKAKPVDLWLANELMEKARALKAARLIDGNVGPTSDDLKVALKALTDGGAGTGDELTTTNMADTLWDDIFLSSMVAGAMETIDMPSDPFDWSLGLGGITWRKGTQNTATTPSDPATAKITLTSTELLAEVNWSYNLDETSVIAVMPAVRARIAQSGAEIIDDFALNADSTDAATGNINSDDQNPANDSYFLSNGQDGLRHLWLVDNTGQGVNAGGDALADDDFTSALAKMGKYAVKPNQVVAVTDISTYLNGFLKLSNVTTVDKFGPDATVLTGQLASYRGVPVIVSASHGLTASDGKADAATPANNTLGNVSFFNRMMWYLGFIRRLQVEMDRDIRKRQIIMVASLREAIAAHGTRSSAKHAAGIRNILV